MNAPSESKRAFQRQPGSHGPPIRQREANNARLRTTVHAHDEATGGRRKGADGTRELGFRLRRMEIHWLISVSTTSLPRLRHRREEPLVTHRHAIGIYCHQNKTFTDVSGKTRVRAGVACRHAVTAPSIRPPGSTPAGHGTPRWCPHKSPTYAQPLPLLPHRRAVEIRRFRSGAALYVVNRRGHH